MKTLATVLAAAFLLSSCKSPDILDHRIEQVLGPVVQVFVGDDWAGSGTVISSEDGKVTVLTAFHVISDRLYAGTPLRVLFQGVEEPVPASLESWSAGMDIAVLAAEGKAKYVAEVFLRGEDPPVNFFSKCYAAGISPFGIPICNQGEVLGYKDEHYYADAHVCFGYSGGALYVEIDGTWKVVGVLVGIGQVSSYPLFHLTVVVDLQSAFDSLENPPLRN